MQFVFLLYADEAAWESMDPEAVGAVMAGHDAVTESMKAQGAYLGGEALELSKTASTVRVREGKALISDGPFIEAKEMLGGFYLAECESREEALAWAARIPEASSGAIEVRPIMDLAALESGDGGA